MTTNSSDIQNLLAMAEKDDVWKSYLFEKLSKISDPLKWLPVLKQKGYFDPKNNPSPYSSEQGYITVPYWEATSYLTRVSELNKLNPQKETTDILTNIIDSIITYRDANGKRIENARTDWAITRIIFNLPLDMIRNDHLDFVKIAVNTKENTILISNELSEKVLPYLIEKKSEKILLTLLDIMLDFEINIQSYFDKFTSIIGDYYLEQIVAKHQKELFEICNLELYNILMDKIKKILAIDKNSFSTIITIEESSQNLSGSYKITLIGLLRDLLASQQPRNVRTRILQLISETNPIFKRLAIYIINQNYADLEDVFWNLEGNPLEEFMLKHELYDLFKDHCRDFTDEQISRILNWIENEDHDKLKKYYKDAKEFEISIAHHKKEWLTSLLETSNPKVTEAYGRYSEIVPGEIEHPGYIVWSSGVVVSTPSKETLDEKLEGKSNEEIVEFLTTYRKDPTKLEDLLTYSDSLSDGFSDYVKRKPAKICERMDAFIDLPCKLQNSLLLGLTGAWQSKEKIEWREVLNYCLKLIGRNAFWEKKDQQRDLVVKSIAELIESGVRDDKNAFGEQYFPLAEKILVILASNDKSPYPSVMNLFTSVLNSTKGTIYSTMIVYSLRHAHVKNEKVWKEEIRRYFERSLEKDEAPIELYVTLGQYLLDVNNLDNNWLTENIDKIFPKDKEELWKAAMTGYFYGLDKLYVQFYDLLRKANDYSKAITTVFDDTFVTRRLVEHICIAYLNGLEDINEPDSLICQIIERSNSQKILELTNFVWRLRQKLSQEQRERIIILWERLVRTLLPKENEKETSQILSSLTNWITVIDILSPQTVELLKISARHVGSDYELFSLVDNLLRLVGDKPREVGEILNEAITRETLLFHKVEDVQKIVTTLYEKQVSDIANEICNKFWNKKQFFLKDIYDKYNRVR